MLVTQGIRRPLTGARSCASATSTWLGRSLSLACVAIATSLEAQSPSALRLDERWNAYVGCWAVNADGYRLAPMCIVPTADAATVELISFLPDSILSRTTVSATAERVMRTRGDCAGWDLARWSLDERRLYVRTEYDCAPGVTQVSTSIFSMTGLNAFTRVDGARTNAGATLRVSHYTVFNDTLTVPKEILRRLAVGNTDAIRAARYRNAAFVSLADVADADKALETPVVEAWLADRGHAYNLSLEDTRRLRDVAVSASVIDVMRGGSGSAIAARTPHASARDLRAPRLRVDRSGAAYAPFERPQRMGPGWVYTSDGWKLAPHFEPPFDFKPLPIVFP